MKTVAIDYGLGNLFSIKQACESVGLELEVTSDKTKIKNAPAIILPGVGAFHHAMQHLTNLELVSVIQDFVKSGKPLLGICLGMQLLFSESHEFGIHRGLALIPGEVEKFPDAKTDGSLIRVPHIGWNKAIVKENNKDWQFINNRFFYFVHSYYAIPASNDFILCTTKYGGIEFCSGIKKENLLAFQFHPEKSGEQGLEVYKKFKNNIK